jgi:2-phospho-L-lactate guanylyltransferase
VIGPTRYPARVSHHGPVSTRVIVPHRGLEEAKTRLAPSLDPAERIMLASQLLQRVLRVAREVTDDIVVISPSRPLGEIVDAAGARLAVQRGMGLNAGLDQARSDAVLDGIHTLVVLHGDLPNLRAEDVFTLLRSLPADGAPGVAIAPDRAGTGTNALAIQPPGVINFRFGSGSFAKHAAEVERARVPCVAVNRGGLAFDLDTPEDLQRWLELGDAA